uniref:Variant surface glycoprotein 1125.4352 n=1 Tax=Trypanosoma brucei TaxID=5691 RepID=A0A1J0RAN8_9TRYP|nr:variant surface glycoprotein 1125.4352 [Trypanosoma brucei]
MLAKVTAIMLVLTQFDISTAVTTGDNEATLRGLCPLLQLADMPIAFDPAVAPPLTEPVELYRLNMSLSSLEWKQRFKPEGEDAAKVPAKLPNDLQDDEWKQKWKLWAEAELYLKTEKNEEKLKALYGIRTATQEQLNEIRREINKLTDTGYEIYTAAAAASSDKPKEDAELAKLLADAVYGDGKSATDDLDQSSLTGDSSGNYAAVCADASTNKGAKKLATAVLCACGVANGASTKVPCGASGETEPKWEADNIPQQPKWTDFRARCLPRRHKSVTAAEIRQAVQTAIGTIHIKATNAYIGKHPTDTCDGDSQGACLKITGGASGNKLVEKKLPWLGAIANVATAVEARTAYNKALTDAAMTLTKLNKMAMVLTKQAHFMLVTTKAAPHKHPVKQTSLEEQRCMQYTANKTCTENNCKWEGTDKSEGDFCKPNDGEGQTNAAEMGKQIPKAKSAPIRKSKKTEKRLLIANGREQSAKITLF